MAGITMFGFYHLTIRANPEALVPISSSTESSESSSSSYQDNSLVEGDAHEISYDASSEGASSVSEIEIEEPSQQLVSDEDSIDDTSGNESVSDTSTDHSHTDLDSVFQNGGLERFASTLTNTDKIFLCIMGQFLRDYVTEECLPISASKELQSRFNEYMNRNMPQLCSDGEYSVEATISSIWKKSNDFLLKLYSPANIGNDMQMWNTADEINMHSQTQQGPIIMFSQSQVLFLHIFCQRYIYRQ